MSKEKDDFFNDDEVIFYKNIRDLSDKLNYFKNNHDKRKKIGEKGQRKYFNYFASTLVSQYIVDIVFDLKFKIKKPWMKK